VIVSFVDFLISFVILIVMMVSYRYSPDWKIITLPFFIIIVFGITLGAGFWFSSLNIKYRDFRYVVPFVVRLGMYISPVGFLSSVVPDKWKLLYSINPMVGVIDGFRWAILGGKADIYIPGFIFSIVLVIVILITGLRHFRKTERTFADII